MANQASHIAFFKYEGAQPKNLKFPGNRTANSIGLDHVPFGVENREELFALKDKLEAAGFDLHGAVDHDLFGQFIF